MRQTNKQKTENVLQITGAGKSFLNITGMGSSPTYQQMGQGETNVYAKLRKLSSEHSNSHRMAENLYTSVKGANLQNVWRTEEARKCNRQLNIGLMNGIDSHPP